MEDSMAIGGAVALSYFGAYLTVSLVEQYRVCMLSKMTFIHRTILLTFSATALGGMTCFAPFLLELTRQGSHVRFNVPLTITALFLVLLLSCFSIYICIFDRVYSKDKPELFKMLMNDMQSASIVSIRKHHAILKCALAKGFTYILSGGVIMGTGVWLMQGCLLSARLGVWSVQFIPHFLLVSYIASIVTCLLGFAMLFRVISLYPNFEWLRVCCALVLSGGLLGSHQAMLCSIRHQQTDIDAVSRGASRDTIILILLGISLLLFCIINQVLLSDLRMRLRWCTRLVAAHAMNSHDSSDKSIIAELHRSIRLYPQQPRVKEKKYRHVKVRPLEPPKALMHFVVMEDEPYEEKRRNSIVFPTATISNEDDKDTSGLNEV